MKESDVRPGLLEELEVRGFQIAAEDFVTDLIAIGVNSINLIQLISALEDRFDIEFELSDLFANPVTVERLEKEIVSLRTRQSATPSHEPISKHRV